MAPNASPGTKPQGDVSQTFWRPNPQESPITPAFSPFTPSLQIPPAQNWPPPHTEPSPRDEIAWSVPQRSSSYSNLDGLQNQQQYSHYPPTNPQHQGLEAYTNKSRIMYPPAITTSGSHSIEHPSATTPHPQSAGALPQGNYPNWQQQPYAYQKAPSNEQYGSYGGQSGYGYGDAPSGSYYPPQSQPGR